MRTRIAVALAVLALNLRGATSTAWEVSGYSDLLKGRLSGLSLSADGALAPGPQVKFSASLEQPAIWSLAAAPDGTLYGSTGHRGKVFRIDPGTGKSNLVWSAEQPEVFAICVDRKGVLYAGTSPNGGIYRIESGKGVQVWKSSAKYIWALAVAPDGGLYVATGDEGKIFHVDGAGKAEVFFETGQANITALVVGIGGHVYAGSDPNGLVYDITGVKQGSILFDSPLPEISSLALGGDGAVYASAMGGSVASRAATSGATATTSQGTVISTTPTVVTVAEADSNVPVTPKADASKGTATSTVVASTPAVVTDVSGADKSAIYRISPDRTVETLRTSKEENAYDVAVRGKDLLFSTDARGRVYRLEDGKATLLAEPGDGESTRLLQANSTLYVAVSSPARVLELATSGGAGTKTFYESQVHDSTTVSRWGRLQWHGRGSGVVFRTRSGNAARPDSTWSAWSEPIVKTEEAAIRSPNARFIQWRAEWPAGATSELDSVYVPYLPQNTPPVIRSINVASISGNSASKTTTGGVSASSAFSVTVTDTGDAAATSTNSSTQIVSRNNNSQTQISWQADDGDGDKLIYSLYFRGDDETRWKVVRSHIFENTVQLDPDVLAEGRYLFRVVASDSPSNAREYARQTELVSAPVLIDNTPPAITIHEPRRVGNRVEVAIDAEDKTSPLRRCEYSVDATAWQPIEASDGVTDSPHEQFSLVLENVSPGEHLIVVRVYDAANNAGLARVVVR